MGSHRPAGPESRSGWECGGISNYEKLQASEEHVVIVRSVGSHDLDKISPVEVKSDA